MSSGELHFPKPVRPPRPCKSPKHLLEISCKDWGLDVEQWCRGDYRPCVVCKGGTAPHEGGCHCCHGTGRMPLFMWRGYYESIMAEWRDKDNEYRERYNLHMEIVRRLTPKMRQYLGI